MWYCNPKDEVPVIDANEELKLLTGELDDTHAKITLAKFLYRNIGFTTELLTGMSLYPDQIINIRGLLNKNFSLNIFSRGGGKSSMAAIYCVLQCIFVPKTKILIAGPTFRTARFIFNYIKDMVDGPGGRILSDVLGKPIQRPDEFKWKIGTSEIIAIPLSGQKIRGFRANVLIVDELFLLSEDIVEKVLMPFLVVPQDISERKRKREIEDGLIAKGMMSESEREVFYNQSKFIGLSSASYTCEYLYKKYQEFLSKIYSNEKTEDGAKYYVSQIAYNGFNNYKDRLEKGITDAAETEANSATFRREYGAQFTDDSDSYFSMAKMLAQTIKDGDLPHLLLRGNKEKKYILSFDTNASNSTTGDDFAMAVVELDDDLKGGTIVHTYAKAGRDLSDHIKYFHYLMTSFNIVMICGDHSGHHQFIDSANQSEHFRMSNMEIKIMEFDSTKEGIDFQEELKKAKRLYNLSSRRILFTVLFREDSIRRMNEHLQGCIDFKKIWFASSIKGDGGAFGQAISSSIDPKPLGYDDMTEMIDDQDILIKQMKYQCAAIEVKTNARGNTTFDLPQILKRTSGPDRMRKDAYSSALLACWGMKTYAEIMNVSEENISATFTPFFA